MEALEKAKLKLREFLLANKEAVAADLEEMRKNSEGKDIFRYMQNVASAFAFNTLTTVKEVEVPYDCIEIQDTDFRFSNSGNIITQEYQYVVVSPHKKKETVSTEKSPRSFLEGFFFNIIVPC